MDVAFLYSVRYVRPTGTKIGECQHILATTSKFRFRENPSDKSPAAPRGQKDGQTYLTEPVVAFRNRFIEAPKIDPKETDYEAVYWIHLA